MDMADNRIARCRTLLCPSPIPLHDSHLHDCHPERSEGPAFSGVGCPTLCSFCKGREYNVHSDPSTQLKSQEAREPIFTFPKSPDFPITQLLNSPGVTPPRDCY